MNDEVVGTAVLSRTPETDGDLHLIVSCAINREGSRKGRKMLISIPVKPAGEAGRPRCWTYRMISPDRIHVEPSLKVSWPKDGDPKNGEEEIFHNAGQWDVDFVVCPEGVEPYAEFVRLNGRDHF